MKEYRYLEVPFTEQEIIDMRAKLSQNITEIARKRSTLESLSKQMKAEIGLLEAETQLLADKANAGKEMRNVEVKSQTDWKKGHFIVTRLDTGEIVEARPLRAEELQQDWVAEESNGR